MMYKILLIDDDVKNLEVTKLFLASHGYDVKTTESPEIALKLIQEEEFALVLADYHMPEMMGDEFASIAHQTNPNQQIAIYSCDLSQQAAIDSLKAGALDFIEKTMPVSKFLKTIEGFCNKYDEAFRTVRLMKDKSVKRLKIESVGMIGQSEEMVALAERVHKVASASDTSVIICGESGTGKELIARALHKLSSRANYPFIAINCGAIPKHLLESELFGHVKGAFTGATENKEGKFKLANGGTIFLDEIGDMPIESQVKLLRVLQERVIDPLGSKTSQKIDVRIISATHRNLDELVKAKLFRDDLVFRLRVVEVESPSLRSRPEDIEPLVEHFTDKINKKYGFKRYFQKRALEIMKGYSWPGNVRELEATVENHLILASANLIKPENLDRKFYESVTLISSVRETWDEIKTEANKLILSKLEKAIEVNEGNKAGAARQLKITSTHFCELLKGARKKIEGDFSLESS